MDSRAGKRSHTYVGQVHFGQKVLNTGANVMAASLTVNEKRLR